MNNWLEEKKKDNRFFTLSNGLITLFLLPLVVGLFIASRKRVQQAESLMVLIAGVLLSAPLLGGFTLIWN